jgi:signal transduction histidine kinase
LCYGIQRIIRLNWVQMLFGYADKSSKEGEQAVERAFDWRRGEQMSSDGLSELERQLKLSQEQAILYGRDLQRVYQAEKARRETLEAISRRMQAVFDSMTGGLLVVGDDLCIKDANPAFCALIEQKVESIAGQPVSTVLPASELDGLLQEAGDEERSTVTGEIELTEPLPRTLLATISRVEAGKSKGWVVVLNDISAWKRVENLKAEFISIASHELRTPLALLMGYTSILADDLLGRLNVTEQEFMNTIVESGERLARIVDELVQFAEAEGGQVRFTELKIDLQEIAHEAISALEARVREKGIEVREEFLPQRAQVRGDRKMLLGVLGHLLENAINFSRPGGKITVVIGERGDFYQVDVKDTGLGIPQVELPRIFDGFYQVEEHMTRQVGGLGLGLSIARRAVRLHGGEIWAESVLGQGSTFSLTLPKAGHGVPDWLAAAEGPTLAELMQELEQVRRSEEDKAQRLTLTQHQLLRYAQDLRRVFENERQRHRQQEERIRNLGKRVEELAVLNEMSTSLSSTLDLDKILTLIMERINAVLKVEAGSLLLIDEETGELVFQIALGEKAEGVKPFRLQIGQGIAGHVAQSGEPLMISDAQNDRRHYKEVDVTTDFLTRSILCVPMIVKGEVIGVIEIMNKLEGDFTESDLTLLNSIATYAAIAIENARLHQSVLAERDRVVVAQEEVQKELARDLHDGPTQLVAAMLMRLDFVKKALTHDPSLIEEEMVQLIDLGQRASHQMRTFLFELRPLVLETKGLVPALETFLTRLRNEEAGTTFHLEVRTERGDDQLIRRDPKDEAAIFAIVQEAVKNALKHAHADNIWIRLAEQAGELMVMVQDDGVGFDTAAVESDYEQRGSLGMVNIRERAELVGGHLTLRSAPGQGTEVMIRVPWGPAD